MRKIFLHPALAVLLLFACSSDGHEDIKHVQRVFMHDTNEYSFLVRDPRGGALRVRKVHAESVTLVRDVPEDQEMWVERRSVSGCAPADGDNVSLVIHLHGVAEVEGAGWERRKGKSTMNGTTQVIE